MGAEEESMPQGRENKPRVVRAARSYEGAETMNKQTLSARKKIQSRKNKNAKRNRDVLGGRDRDMKPMTETEKSALGATMAPMSFHFHPGKTYFHTQTPLLS